MQKHIRSRLAELQREYAVGETRLRQLAEQEVALREALLRIGGAIQVLEELMISPDGGDTLIPSDEPKRAAAGGRPVDSWSATESEKPITEPDMMSVP